MKPILLKSLIPAVLVIAALAAGTSLLAGYMNGPTQVPQAAVEAPQGGCPHLNAATCPKMTAASVDPQVNAAATACPGMASTTSPCTGMAAGTVPCTGAEDCPMPCCQKTGEAPAAGCTMGQPQAAPSTDQAVSPCGAGGCTQEK